MLKAITFILIQIDDRISIHVKKELLHPDNFDIMILHYMGIDYVGRTAGSCLTYILHPMFSILRQNSQKPEM